MNPPQDPADRCEDYRLVLAHLSAYLGAGFGDENTTADQYDKNIRWGISDHVRRLTQYCEELRAKLAKLGMIEPQTEGKK